MIGPEDIKIKYIDTEKRIAMVNIQATAKILPITNIESLDKIFVKTFNEKIYGDIVKEIKGIQILMKKREPSDYIRKKINKLIKQLEWGN